MKKRTYESPLIEVVDIQLEECVSAGSGGIVSERPFLKTDSSPKTTVTTTLKGSDVGWDNTDF